MTSKVDLIKETGATFTPSGLANYLAEKLISYGIENNPTILDPSCGDGALLMSISAALQKRNFPFEIHGYDSNEDYLSVAKDNLLAQNKISNAKLFKADFLEAIELKKEMKTLFSEQSDEISEFADLIIANPPYVRTQILGAEKAQLLSKKFNLKGRVDLYYPFLIAMTHALKDNGILGVITSNRYLFTKSGQSIRKFLDDNFQILEVIDLGDTKLFDAAVLPAIFIGRKKVGANNSKASFTKIYEDHNQFSGDSSNRKDVYDILSSMDDGYYNDGQKTYKKTTGILKFGKTKENTWTMLSNQEAAWIEQVEKNAHSKISDHFSVKVGIKTTADKVFISEKWDELKELIPEDELLKDLISQENIKTWGTCDKTKLKVLYPHYSENGKKKTIDLAKYPKAESYLMQHEEKLKGRKYVIDSGRNWYEIWVPQNPSLWKYPKVVFPDISVNPRFYFDESGKIVNGNCYWIVADKKDQEDFLLLIQGIANSKLMTKYHDLVFNNKLYSGRRRYFSQYVENYPLPDIKSPHSQKIIQLTRELNKNLTEAIKEQKLKELEELIAKTFGVDPVYSLAE